MMIHVIALTLAAWPVRLLDGGTIEVEIVESRPESATVDGGRLDATSEDAAIVPDTGTISGTEGEAYIDPLAIASSSECSEAWPCRTVAEGLAVAETGLRLRGGSTFAGPLSLAWERSGTPDQPFTVRAYGEGRARFETRAGQACLRRRRDVPVHDVIWSDIDCVSIDRDYTAPGFRGPIPGSADDTECVRLVGEAHGEGYTLRRFGCAYYAQGLVIHRKGTDTIYRVELDRVTMRATYPAGTGQATGLFLDGVEGVVIRDSVFDSQGGLRSIAGVAAPHIAGVDDEALRIDCYDHAMYLQGGTVRDVLIERVLVAHSGSVEIRSGGVLRDLVVAYGADLVTYGTGNADAVTAGGVSGSIEHAVLYAPGDYEGTPAGCSGRVKGRAIRVGNVASLDVRDVVIASSRSEAASTQRPIILDGQSACSAELAGLCVRDTTIERVTTYDATPPAGVEVRGAVEYLEASTRWQAGSSGDLGARIDALIAASRRGEDVDVLSVTR